MLHKIMPKYPTADWLGSRSALALAEKIRNYWLARGADPQMWVEIFIPDGKDPEGKAKPLYVVRSNLAQLLGRMPK